MRKEIEVNGRKVALECNSATPLVMKRIFKFDFIILAFDDHQRFNSLFHVYHHLS